MSPSQFYPKKEINPNEMYPSHPLKINRDSHFIKKSPLSSSVSVSASALASKPPRRQPVIIYTHSPKVIHTNPNDFMAIVQKLTGLSGAYGSPNPSPETEPKDGIHGTEDINKIITKAANSDDSESSVVTEDSLPSTIIENVHINSCFPPTPIFDPNTNRCFNNIPMFTPNDYLYSARPFFNNYADPFLLMPNMRSAASSSTNMEALKEFHEF